MQLINFAIFASLAAALPQTVVEPPAKGDKFGLIAIHSGSPVQNVGITARKGSIRVGGKQHASCLKKSDYATFYLKDGAAFLYNKGEEPQQLWVDRSGMGQGISGFTTGAQPAPKNAERKGFKIDKNGLLVFHGISPQACPTGAKDGAYSLWFSTAENPGFNKDCVGVALRAIKADKPVSCVYTSS